MTSDTGLRPPKPLDASTEASIAWEDWLQAYEWYETAAQLSKKPPEIQVATFMSVIGPDAQKIFKTFTLTEEQLKDVKVIKQNFTAHFTPQINHAYERYKFNQMVQQEGETFTAYVTAARLQANRCNYGPLTEELLRDRIIVGVKNDYVREKLLTDPAITLEKAINLCKANEQAAQQIKDMTESAKAVDAVETHNKHLKKHNAAEKKAGKSPPGKPAGKKCGYCGNQHRKGNCPAYGKTCGTCGKVGHFAAVCKTGKRKVKEVDAIEHQESEEEEMFISELRDEQGESTNEDWHETITFQCGETVRMKLDTGAQCNVLPLHTVKRLNLAISQSSVKRLVSYTQHRLPIAGECVASCTVRGRRVKIKFTVADGHVTPILGRNACDLLNLVKRVHTVEEATVDEHAVKDTDSSIYQGMGCIRGFVYEADLKEDVSHNENRPPRKVPYAIQEDVKKELDNMETAGIIKKIQEPTPFCSQMVIVKRKGKLRICLDPTDLNKILLRRHYPLRTLEEIAAQVHGSKVFTLLDLKKGFWQLTVSEKTQKYLAFSTPWGRYTFLRVPFGIATAPEVFQQVVSEILKGIPNVANSMDDILVYAKTTEELEKYTQEVLTRLKDAGAKLNQEKCVYNQSKVKFLGHVLTDKGLKVDQEKVEAIEKIAEPKNKTELQRLLGMLQYLQKFIPHLAEKAIPLRKLVKQDTAWLWTEEQSTALQTIKDALRAAPTLQYYDVNGKLTLSVDASSKALGAVLLQEGKPLAYASATLNPAQMNYPQIEKEALAIRYGCKKFHSYIYGRPLTIETDHRPLETISKKPLGRVPPRLQRLLFDVQHYAPTIVYKRGKDLHIADLLSRDCRTEETTDLGADELEVLELIPMGEETFKELAATVEQDEQLQSVLEALRTGWPTADKMTEAQKLFSPVQDELSEYDGLLFRGDRVVIPKTWKQRVLKAVHSGHLGINSCLKRARETVYWPGMSNDIRNLVKGCSICENSQRRPPREPLMPKEIPNLPWERVAIDLFDFNRKPHVIIVDSYSGYIDFKELRNASAAEVVRAMKEWFATHGIPRVVESDNGPCFTALEFRRFEAEWQFRLITSSPLYPRSNGLAERAVQTIKNLLKRCAKDGSDIQAALLNLRNVPRDGDLGSPVQRLYGRRTRTTVPTKSNLLKPGVIPDVTQKMMQARARQKVNADKHATKAPTMEAGDRVKLLTDHRNWVPAQVVRKHQSPRSYIVRTNTGTFRRNSSVIRPTRAQLTTSHHSALPETDDPNEAQPPPPPVTSLPGPAPAYVTTRAGRIVKPVQRLDL